ncbi:hypothetical protein TWF696_005123 [Orbilia brochopaga]|uniref:Uncharacterized protein n=1 Tax=Orbilia brochopaga TaxID=3140254 RepID=A0AAV9V034_9PEZI
MDDIEETIDAEGPDFEWPSNPPPTHHRVFTLGRTTYRILIFPRNQSMEWYVQSMFLIGSALGFLRRRLTLGGGEMRGRQFVGEIAGLAMLPPALGYLARAARVVPFSIWTFAAFALGFVMSAIVLTTGILLLAWWAEPREFDGYLRVLVRYGSGGQERTLDSRRRAAEFEDGEDLDLGDVVMNGGPGIDGDSDSDDGHLVCGIN